MNCQWKVLLNTLVKRYHLNIGNITTAETLFIPEHISLSLFWRPLIGHLVSERKRLSRPSIFLSFVWVARLGPKSKPFLIYQPIPLYQKPILMSLSGFSNLFWKCALRQSKIVKKSNKNEQITLFRFFKSIYKRIWD